MALQLSYDGNTGATSTTAYSKVSVESVIKDSDGVFNIKYRLNIYHDSDSVGKSVIGYYENTCVYDLEGSNLLTQCYTDIKSQDEFSAATDV